MSYCLIKLTHSLRPEKSERKFVERLSSAIRAWQMFSLAEVARPRREARRPPVRSVLTLFGCDCSLFLWRFREDLEFCIISSKYLFCTIPIETKNEYRSECVRRGSCEMPLNFQTVFVLRFACDGRHMTVRVAALAACFPRAFSRTGCRLCLIPTSSLFLRRRRRGL